MQNVYDRDTGGTRIENSSMALKNSKGDIRNRKLLTIFNANDDKRIIRFLMPSSIDKTSFLNIEKSGIDTQYLYLPAYNKTKRIGNTERSRSFMGTDFTYEDLMGRELDQDNHSCLKKEKLGDKDVFQVLSIPKENTASAYGKIISWVDIQSWVVVKSNYFDKSLIHEKNFIVNKLEKNNSVWNVHDSTMSNVKHSHSTNIKINIISYRPDIVEALFHKNNLSNETIP